MTLHFPFDNTYARLPERFYTHTAPTEVAGPSLIRMNRQLASDLDLDPDRLGSEEGVEVLAGKRVDEGSEPIATAYAGHQFGNFVPQLGDGRAILLGEVIDRHGIRRDIQLKGAGRTPFSRGGDGRAALGPVLREYILCEAMAALGIPTTRALAAVLTGEAVMRETLVPGAVFTRVASSHIRVGTFQFFAAREDTDGVKLLAGHVISRHYPQAAEAERPCLALLDCIIKGQAELVAQWLLVGFIHGVMNTDNMSIAGESIDYGPCAFLDAYDPAKVFSSIDRNGRYAFANQPRIALWNLTRLAETLLPLLSGNEDEAVALAKDALERFAPSFEEAFNRGMRKKLGLFTKQPEDVDLARDLLTAMAEGRADFTLTFRKLADAALGPESDEEVRCLFTDPAAYDTWSTRWWKRLETEPQSGSERQAAMQEVNPAFIPRNHRVEGVIRAAVDRNDFGPFQELLGVLEHPFRDQPAFARYADPPEKHELVLQTFCGT